MKKIVYWGPFIDTVATVKAILNSSISINKYSKNYNSVILNVAGEWDFDRYIIRLTWRNKRKLY